MKHGKKFYFVRLASILIVVVVLSVLYQNYWEQIVGALTGYLLATLAGDFVLFVIAFFEDKNKVFRGDNFTYDREYYAKTVNVGGKSTVFWFEPLDRDGYEYTVRDDPRKHFELDSIIKSNYAAIMPAHSESYKENLSMIRLDDVIFDESAKKATLLTSRTDFFNDLVTNRSMDYKFNGDLTIRQIYENGNFLTDLAESKMSNHIGYGALVFHRGKLILASRKGNATISKHQITESLAIGLSENQVIAGHDPLNGKHFIERRPVMSTCDLFLNSLMVPLSGALNLKLEDMRKYYENDLLKIYFLGFGRLIYSGGKPQFYFIAVLDDNVNLDNINNRSPRNLDDNAGKHKKKRVIDQNSKMILADGVRLKKEGKYKIEIKVGRRIISKNAQRSFFVNWWYAQRGPHIEGVPDWFYAQNAN